jgi:hypothetical protein
MISQKVVSDVYAFASTVLTWVVSNLYGAFIVTYERNVVHSVTIVLEGLSHPKWLCTITTGGNILRFGRG